MEKYKYHIKERKPIGGPDDMLHFETIQFIDRVKSTLNALEQTIVKRNRRLSQREAAATAASEYLRPNLQEIQGPDENRHLLIQGIEFSIDLMECEIQKNADELNRMANTILKHFKERVEPKK